MDLKGTTNRSDAMRLVALYNAVPNVFWSVVSLLPLTVFCYTWMDLERFLLFLVISLVPAFLPIALIHKLQLAGRPAPYKQLGVAFVQRFSQNGSLINRLVRKKYPDYKALPGDTRSLKKLWHQTYMLEKFHWMLFVFFSLTGLFALWKGLAGWAAFIFLANLVYNVYPILLQQYIRVKLALYRKKSRL